MKTRKNFRWALILLSLFTFLSNCNPNKSKTTLSRKPTDDFDKFYNKFHADSLFQMSRLKFPLAGHDEFGNQWTVKNWHVLKGKIYDVDKTKYKVEFKKTETGFFQRVWVEYSGFNSECRFQLIDGKWFLVYDLEQNN